MRGQGVATFKARDKRPDHLKYTRELQKGHKNRPLERRGPLFFPEVLVDFVTDPVQIRRIKLIASARCKATQMVHNRSLVKLNNYCQKYHNTSIMELSDSIILDYLFECEERMVKSSYFSGLHGAVSFLQAAVQIPDPWNSSVSRAYEGLTRRAASEKPAVRKAPMLPLKVLQAALEKFILPYQGNLDMIPLQTYRCLLLQFMQVKLLARVSDLQKLRACDFEATMLGNTPVIAVKFRTAKNDPR